MKNSTRKSLVSLLLLIPLLFAPFLQASAAQFSGVISIDVNPSIELTVENGVVTGASAYNDDGRELISGGDVVGLTAEEAVQAMIQQLIESGFLVSDSYTPYLLITASGADEETTQALQQTAEQVALDLNAKFEVLTGLVSEDISAAAEAAGLTPGKYLLMEYIAEQEGISLEDAIKLYGETPIGELADQYGDFGLLLEAADLLTEEQMAALNAAFEQMKASITAAEGVYQDAIKALKDRYRVTVQDAVKNIEDETELAAIIDRLKSEILADYAGIQKTLDGTVAAARDEFQRAVDTAQIPSELYTSYLSWHLNKELNAANELTNFVESFKNLSGNGKSEQGQGKSDESSGQQSMNGNVEQNKEENSNQGDKQNKEQEKQEEQNDEGQKQDNQNGKQQGAQQQDTQQSQSQSNSKSGKGKGGN